MPVLGVFLQPVRDEDRGRRLGLVIHLGGQEVGHDANDGEPRRPFEIEQLDAPADGIQAAEVGRAQEPLPERVRPRGVAGRDHAADEAHVDERHGRALLLVARGEPASADQRHVQRLEEASRHAGMQHPLLLPGLHRRAVDDHRAAIAPAVERYEVRRRRGANAGHALHAREDVLEAPGLGARLRIRVAGQVDPHRHERRGLEAGVRALQLQEAPHEERRADEEDQRERDLSDDEHVACPCARAAAPRPAPLAHGRAQVRLRDLPRRREAEQHARERRDRDRVDQRRPVDAELDQVGHVVGGHACRDERDADFREDDAQRDRHEAQHERLGEQLPREAPARGAEGRPQGHLARARRGAGQQQVGDVRAGDQQDQRHGAKGGERRNLHLVRREIVPQRPHVRAPALVLGVGRGEPVRHGAQLFARPLDRHTRLEPPEKLQIPRAPGRIVRKWRQRDVRHLQEGEVHVGRQHADDRVRPAVDADGPTDDGRIGLVAAPPELIGQDDDRSGARLVVSRVDLSTERRDDAEHAEQARAHGSARDPLGIRAAGQRQAAILDGDERVEGGRLALPVEEVAVRRRRPAAARGAPHRPGIHEAIGIAERQRLDERRVHDAEHRRVGADAERQAEDGQAGQHGRPAQRAERVANVLGEGIHEASESAGGYQIACQEVRGKGRCNGAIHRERGRPRVSECGRSRPGSEALEATCSRAGRRRCCARRRSTAPGARAGRRAASSPRPAWSNPSRRS